MNVPGGVYIKELKFDALMMYSLETRSVDRMKEVLSVELTISIYVHASFWVIYENGFLLIISNRHEISNEYKFYRYEDTKSEINFAPISSAILKR